MNLDAFNHRAVLSRPGESSRLWSAREPHAPGNNWKPQLHAAGRADNHSTEIQQLTQRVAQLERQRHGMSGMHPFKIYQFPSNLRKFHNDDDWRRFKVRYGNVFTSGEQIKGEANGTDLVIYDRLDDVYTGRGISQVPPSNSSQVIPSVWNEVAVPADGTEYYFWFSLSCSNDPNAFFSNASVLFGETLTGAFSMASGNTFDDLSGSNDGTNTSGSPDVNNPYRRLIGSVVIYPDDRAMPYFLPNVPYIRQEAANDIFFPSYGNAGNFYPTPRFRGLYDATFQYYTGDVVTVETADGAGHKALSTWIMQPVPPLSAYDPVFGPAVGISPLSFSPDPWFQLSYSLTSLTYFTGAYDASKYYGRTT